jgi:ABC-type sugar transport system permease subunit
MQAPTLPKASRASSRIKTRQRQPALWRQILSNGWSYLYLAPMLILLATFIIYPLFASLGYTLYQWNGIGDPTIYVGPDNFQRVIHDPIFWGSFLHTFVYTAVLVPVQLTLALILALVLNNPKLRFATFYRAVYFLPVVTSAAVVGVVVRLILTNFGDKLNTILLNLRLTHVHIDWLGDPRFALGIIIIVGIWNTLGYNLVYFLAGLQTIPNDLYEAAKIDGANAPARFIYITIPMLRGVGLIILILAILGSLQVFDLVQVLTNGGPYFATEVVNTYIYHQAFGGYSATFVAPNIGFASAASFFYGLLLIGLSLVQLFIFRYALGRRTAVHGQ